ncbi:hypothetical protein MRX96_044934 [Rhipicephalus microplus]
MSCAQQELMEISVQTSATAKMEALVTRSLGAASALRVGRVLCVQIHVLLASTAPTAVNVATATMVPSDECPVGTYGLNCSKKCDCENGASCNVTNGQCICLPGFTGPRCESRACTDELYGPKCEHVCQCDKENSIMCHPWTGHCKCKPGWNGETCSRPCMQLFYGPECSLTCSCETTAPATLSTAHASVNQASLAPTAANGVLQASLELTAPQNCSCENNGVCSHVNGLCQCPPGYAKSRCNELCPVGTYGLNCQSKCKCKHGAACNPVTGQCTCSPGYLGEFCEFKCDHGRYGQNCENKCKCNWAHSLGCDYITGKCMCAPGIKGVSCESQWTAVNHAQLASLARTARRNVRSACTAMAVPATTSPGNASAAPDIWACGAASLALWTSGGDNCSQKCMCQHGGECNSVTGACLCMPGWQGDNCTTPCTNGTYGFNCTQKCTCQNGGLLPSQ